MNAARARTLRLVIVADTLDGAGGLEILELRLGRALASLGWDVRLLYRHPGDLLVEWQAFASTEVIGDLTADDLATADVVYSNSPSLFSDVVAAAGVAGRPAVFHLHLPPDGVRAGWRAVRGRVGWRVPSTWVDPASPVAAWVAVSHDTAHLWRLAGVPAGSLRVVHNGIDPDEFRPDEVARAAVRHELGLADGETAVGFVGRIDQMKGIDALCEAIQRIRGRDPLVRLVVVGEESRFRREAGDRFASDLRERYDGPGFLWLGRRSDTARLFRGFDLSVTPSRWREPFGLVIVEAMASGVPVIASPNGGISEILTGDLARWRTRPTVGGLERAIDRMMALGPATLGQHVRQHVLDHFTIERMSAQIDLLLRRVTGERNDAASAP